MSVTATDIIVNKSNLSEAKLHETSLPGPDELSDGQALLKIDTYALTANNISYGVAGDFLGYWDFFPADDGYGRIPVWGFADVVASRAEGVQTGDRLYGYYPMGTHLLVEPGRVTQHSFLDMAEHRQARSPLYNQYLFTKTDAAHSPELEPEISLFRPLFTTSFLLDDYLDDNGFFGADTVVLSSASSKTALGLAFILSKRGGPKVIGLTSPRNKAFVESLGLYDEAIAYDDLETLENRPTAFVDMAGNADVIRRLHMHLTDNLKDSCLVGATHWEASGLGGNTGDLPGPKPQMFFAPTHAKKRMDDWTPAGFQDRVSAVWADFIPQTKAWMHHTNIKGAAAALDAYLETLAGKVDPSNGQIVSLWTD